MEKQLMIKIFDYLDTIDYRDLINYQEPDNRSNNSFNSDDEDIYNLIQENTLTIILILKYLKQLQLQTKLS